VESTRLNAAFDDGVSAFNYLATSGTNDYRDGKWYHVAFTHDGINFKIYVNGLLSSSRTSSWIGVTRWPTNTFNLGRDNNNVNYFFKGNIGTFRLYNKTLTEEEVLQNYNTGLSRFNTQNIVKNNLIINLDSSNSVSYIGSGTTWVDLSGNGNKGTLTNGPTFDSTSKSIVFDGIDDFMQANISSKDLDGDPTFTVDMVVKRNLGTNIGPNYGFWGIGGTGQGNSVQGWTPTQNLIHLDVYDSTRLATSEYYPENQYIHLVWTKNGPGQETTNVKCYVNGVEKSLTKTRNATRTNQFNTSTNGVGVCLGRINGDSSNFQSPVTVSSFRVYNNALSQTEVLQNYYQAPIVTDGLVMALDAGNLVSYSGAGTTWKDLTSSGNNVLLTNGPTYSTDGGGCIVFDGSDDYAKNDTPTLPTGNVTTTICAWIYVVSGYNGWQGIVGWGDAGLTSKSALLDMNAGRLAFSTWGNLGSQDLISAYTVPKDTWKYVVGSINNKNIKLYADGVKVLDSSITSTPNVTSTKLRLATTDYPGRLLNTKISNVQIYNRELSADEIAQNYNAYKSRFGL
jgi:hypothetical protein